MSRILTSLLAAAMLTGCIAITPSRPDSSYYRILIPDCANKEAQLQYLNRQLSRGGIGPASEVRKQEAEIKRVIWEVRATCQ